MYWRWSYSNSTKGVILEAGLAERRAFTLVLGEVTAYICIYSGQCWHGFSKPVRVMICLAKLGQGKISFGMYAGRNIIQHNPHTKSNQRMADYRKFFFDNRTRSIFGYLNLRRSQFARLPILISFTHYYRHGYHGPSLYPTAISIYNPR